MTGTSENLTDVFFHWQTLLGSILGGIIALLAALIVADSQTRRERRAAASLVLTDLISIETTASKLKQLSIDHQIDGENYPGWLVDKLEWRRPKLSSFFEMEVVRLLDLHPALAAHINLLWTIFPAIEESLERLRHDQEQANAGNLSTPPRAPSRQAADEESIARALDLSGAHARYAQHYIGELVFGSFPTFARLRMCLWKTKTEKSSWDLLQTGGI